MKTKHASKHRKTRAAMSAPRKHRKSRLAVSSHAETSPQSGRPFATLEFIEEPEKSTETLAGDRFGIPRTKFSAGEESMAELIEEGQALEGELVESLGTTREGDEGTLSVRKIPRERIPDYKNRNRL